jgi:hypothetical protein
MNVIGVVPEFPSVTPASPIEIRGLSLSSSVGTIGCELDAEPVKRPSPKLSQRSAGDRRSVDKPPGVIANALASRTGATSASSEKPTTGSTCRT